MSGEGINKYNFCYRSHRAIISNIFNFVISNPPPLTPGITADCLRRCSNELDCVAINLDHNRYECNGLVAAASSQPSTDLGPYAGGDHYEGLCLSSELGGPLRGVVSQ